MAENYGFVNSGNSLKKKRSTRNFKWKMMMMMMMKIQANN